MRREQRKERQKLALAGMIVRRGLCYRSDSRPSVHIIRLDLQKSPTCYVRVGLCLRNGLFFGGLFPEAKRYANEGLFVSGAKFYPFQSGVMSPHSEECD